MTRPSRFARLATTAVAAMVVASAFAGCSDERDRYKDTVLDAIAKTERTPRRFVYAATDLLGTATVRAAVADDLQYKAEVEIGGRPAVEEVASDDALAVRFVDPTRIMRFLSRDAAISIGQSSLTDEQKAAAAAEIEALAGQASAAGEGGQAGGAALASGLGAGPGAGVKPLSKAANDALRPLTERRWVLDGTGAPDLYAVDRSVAVGDDPVLDGLEVLAYVRRAIDEHGFLAIYNPDSTAYRPAEDPFPRPELESGIERYDTVQPDLPRDSDTTDTGSRPLSELRHFRKLSVYVKDGFVIAVREQIDVLSRVDDLREAYETDFPSGLKGKELEQALLQSLNTMRLAEGRDPLRLRTMSVEFRDFDADIDVALPTDVVAGDLSALRRRGTATVNATAIAGGEADEPDGSTAKDAPTPVAPSAEEAPPQSPVAPGTPSS